MARSRKPTAAPIGMGPMLPPSMTGGNLPGSPQAGFPSPIGKSRTIQNLGNLSGRMTAGLTKGLLGPDQQFRHAFSHYGKGKDTSLD